MGQHILNRERETTHATSNFILRIYFHDNFRWLLHLSIVAARTLITISLAATSAEELTTISIRALSRIIENLLTYATNEIFINAFETWGAQPQNVETLLLHV
jgi:hypothetical protein